MKELPLYKCHKEVRALKIAAIEIYPDKLALIAPVDSEFQPFKTRVGWANNWHGTEDDLGYYVEYKDGYTSWSPTKAFEEGYNLCQPNQ